ncbi:MAG: TIM barrel protein [Verrucomicrobiota bacterium]
MITDFRALTRRSCLRAAAGLLATPVLAQTVPGGGTATATAAAAAAADGKPAEASAPADGKTPVGPQFCLFTKHLLGMSFDQLAAHAAELDIPGLEAPIRPGGHVEPERIEEDLPKLVEALTKAGRHLSILTSGISKVSKDQFTERVLRTAKSQGIPFYRMNWWRYDLKKPIPPQLENFRAQAKDLIALSREIGIRPLYQNHKGAEMVGSPVWDVASLMKDHAPEDWGFAFDIMHASVEGGTNWPLQYHMARERIGAALFKDFTWRDRRTTVSCPLGEGFAGAPEYAKLLRQSGFNGPVVLHIEYLPAVKITSSAEATAALNAGRRDFAKLREFWAA